MFRPCIDLRAGRVTQIVGGTLSDHGENVRVNFESERPATWYAALYRHDNLHGGHVILLDPAHEATRTAALTALAEFPGGLQLGGGVNLDNARTWLDAGASQVIVTSWVFREGRVDRERLAALMKSIGRDRLVLDLSCRRRGDDYFVVTDRWQKFTEERISAALLDQLAASCAEFLVHAADVEGLCRGIDFQLVERLAAWTPLPVTYAGGAESMTDLETVTRIGRGRIDLTIGSALDIFGGTGVRYEDAVRFNREQNSVR